jgi:hypothetical protein
MPIIHTTDTHCKINNARNSNNPGRAIITAGLKYRMLRPIRGFKVAYMDTVTMQFIQEAMQIKLCFIMRCNNAPK